MDKPSEMMGPLSFIYAGLLALGSIFAFIRYLFPRK
jgi:hypothetical protein